MTHAFLIRVGETWIAAVPRLDGRRPYLVPSREKHKAHRFSRDEAERTAADLSKRESLFEQSNVRTARPVEILAAND